MRLEQNFNKLIYTQIQRQTKYTVLQQIVKCLKKQKQKKSLG